MRLKNVVIVSMITALIIPFILLTDIYPFLRFGMFAESVKYTNQMEVFAIRYIDAQQHLHLMDEEQIGLSGLSYLLRNYYYRNQSKQLLQHIDQIYNDKQPVAEWQLLKILGTTKPPYQADTTVVEKFIPKHNSL